MFDNVKILVRTMVVKKEVQSTKLEVNRTSTSSRVMYSLLAKQKQLIIRSMETNTPGVPTAFLMVNYEGGVIPVSGGARNLLGQDVPFEG